MSEPTTYKSMKTTRSLYIPVFLLLSLLFACGRSADTYEATESADYASKEMDAAAPAMEGKSSLVRSDAQADAPAPRFSEKLIRNGQMGMEVKSYSEAMQHIRKLVTAQRAYISSEDESRTDFRLGNTITIRVLSGSYDSLVSQLEKQAMRVDYKRVSIEDITAQYYDIKTRLETRRKVEQRYVELLGKARNMEEILQVEQQLKQVREEIESAEGMIRLWNDQVAYSTLVLEVYQTLDYSYQPPSKPGFWNRLFKGILEGWDILQNLVVGIVTLWPVFLLVFVLVWLFYKWRRRRSA